MESTGMRGSGGGAAGGPGLARGGCGAAQVLARIREDLRADHHGRSTNVEIRIIGRHSVKVAKTLAITHAYLCTFV